jgi:phosphoribosylanthranilate isomerase
MKGLIQIAGIIDEAEARLLLDCGVDQIGFPLRVALHREDILEEEAAHIIHHLHAHERTILITYLNRAEEIIDLAGKIGVRKVQLHSEIPLDEMAGLKELAPGIYLIKSLIVKNDNLAQLEKLVMDYSSWTDAFITDTYDPQTGLTGATGKIHNWDISRQLCELSPLPVILAGGLNPANVHEAVLRVRPSGVDTHTGVEDRDGRKNPELVRAFVKQARDAFAVL